MNDLSVIIVTYNSEGFIKECLNSVFKNISGLDFEVILIDNNSTDRTLGIVIENFKTKSNFKIIENRENLGFAKGINQGIKLSRGKKILFLNPDTLILKDSLFSLVKFLDSREEVGAVGCRTENKEGEINPSFGYFPRIWFELFWAIGLRKFLGHTVYPHFWNKKKFFENHEVDWLSGACFLIKREVIEKVGLLDERFFMYFEDIDLCKRIKEKGYKIFYLGETLINHELGKSEKISAKRNLYEMNSLLAYFEKHLPRQLFFLKILIKMRRVLLNLRPWAKAR